MFILSVGPQKKKPPPKPTRHKPYQTFALKHALDPTRRYAPHEGKKRCKGGRVRKPRIDPRDMFPRRRDFMARYRLPPDIVQELTEEWENSPFRPGKGEGERRGGPIPLFHKVKFTYILTVKFYLSTLAVSYQCSEFY